MQKLRKIDEKGSRDSNVRLIFYAPPFSTFSNIVDFVRYELEMVQGSIRNPLQNDFKNIKLRYLFKKKRMKKRIS